ncbi:Anhydrotetracycline monooxygenase [Cytospora mali]|uniref:Anhydrotetracycline monooxygenase n=1 Tax=Cytospora mali TaxID=578113 RepID=A0A194UQH7_CYTMA|nr:Anhydrotetracycline monooxygenase [Valsa mali var. pyri (nom. inval.)]
MEAKKSFKVIIAGGSIVGLTLANALEKAGIDFLVLERGDIAPQLGASVSIYCNASRVLDQLGVWKGIHQSTIPLTDRLYFDEHGRLFEDNKMMRLIDDKTKRPITFLRREAYIRALYENLKDKSKVKGHSGLVSFAEDDEGVSVFTSTGEEIRGSILVGADGIHSTVRKLMAESVAKSDPQRAKNLIEGFTANYRTIFGTSKNQRKDDPSVQMVADSLSHTSYYRGVTGVCAVGNSGVIYWFLLVKEDTPSTMPNCPRYSEADAEETLRKFGHLHMGPGYTFNDLWELREKGVMVPLQEGIVEGSWNSSGRVVLMGDAVHKFTISAGLGANLGVEGACHLVNELLPVLKETENPGKQEIKDVLDRYEEKHRPRTKICAVLSNYLTKYEAMETWWLRLLRFIIPRIPDSYKAKSFVDFMYGAPILDFLPHPGKSSA